MPGTPHPSTAATIIVIGIGADGWSGLSDESRHHVSRASVVLGGPRHLALLPEVAGQRRLPWPRPLRAGLRELLAGLEGAVVALASGDPMVSGIGSTLVDALGPDRVVVVPAVSSVALARAEMRWPAESHATVSVVGRDVSLVRRQLAPGRRILVLSADEHTPFQVARLLVDAGYARSLVTVLGDLGSERSTVVGPRAAAGLVDDHGDLPRLNVVAVDCVGPHLGGWVAGLPDDAFEHDGQLTKRDLRASALARIAPAPGEHLWDVGAGAGSVAIEWMRADPTCTATAVEADAERVARITRNASRLGVPGLQVVHGTAPEALAGLPAPDAVFVGGGATRAGVVDSAMAALRPGGRLVVHGVTLETERLLAVLYAEHGGELTRLGVESVAPIGSFTGWAPARTVTQWALMR
ncbi:precorrin-6y C5,15-methyltransferase (decarboxylating) subunit CbiE [Nocardioides terrisoli]|uniref:precorrin-6y C5,15-methyltransferase (decarboxylating) subunit CbiE n=1 Tax=Nocardioides terrisoli TaxID=3388267 RepID=UPI00287BB463|nr:precorrin-6y C5,15-methyltransferase (decarboxylating) subunit CbiE [Nocardioides marmorisolisilvae]